MRPALVAAVLLLAPASADAKLKLERTEQLTDRLTAYTFSTPSLNFPADVRVLLPRDYAKHPRRRYPVLYLLHGSFDNAASWQEKGDAERITEGKPVIVVMPDTAGTGDAGGWATDWDNEGRGGPPRYETYTIRELIPWVESRFRTRARRGGRAIVGLSMGGFSAMSYAVRHPDLFAHAASFSGAVDTNYAPSWPVIYAETLADGGATIDSIWGSRVTDEVVWRTHNPWDLAGNLQSMKLAIRTGNGVAGPLDENGLPLDPIEAACHEMSLSLHNRLAELGYAHVWDDYGPGTHSWPYWQRDLELELPRIMATFRKPPRRPRAFTYRTAEPRFEVYRWRVRREDGDHAFAVLARASRRGFDYTGPGPARIVTPPYYRPRSRHAVGLPGGNRFVRADRRGRLRFSVGAEARVAIA